MVEILLRHSGPILSYYYQGYDPNVIKVCPLRLRLIHCNDYKNVSFQLCMSVKDSVKLF